MSSKELAASIRTAIKAKKITGVSVRIRDGYINVEWNGGPDVSTVANAFVHTVEIPQHMKRNVHLTRDYRGYSMGNIREWLVR